MNEREDQIVAYKKREAAMEQHLASKDKLVEQEVNIRVQLSKRLEQVMMDREELKDSVSSLKVYISNLCIPFRQFTFILYLRPNSQR